MTSLNGYLARYLHASVTGASRTLCSCKRSYMATEKNDFQQVNMTMVRSTRLQGQLPAPKRTWTQFRTIIEPGNVEKWADQFWLASGQAKLGVNAETCQNPPFPEKGFREGPNYWKIQTNPDQSHVWTSHLLSKLPYTFSRVNFHRFRNISLNWIYYQIISYFFICFMIGVIKIS